MRARSASRRVPSVVLVVLSLAAGAAPVHAQTADDFVPVTDAMLEAPAP